MLSSYLKMNLRCQIIHSMKLFIDKECTVQGDIAFSESHIFVPGYIILKHLNVLLLNGDVSIDNMTIGKSK